MTDDFHKSGPEADSDAYIAMIRKAIAESSALVTQAEMRIAETDRFLSEQGLTREQLLNVKFTPEQKLAVNEELRKRGLPVIEDDLDMAEDLARIDSVGRPVEPNFEAGDVHTDLKERHRKFGLMMKPFQI